MNKRCKAERAVLMERMRPHRGILLIAGVLHSGVTARRGR